MNAKEARKKDAENLEGHIYKLIENKYIVDKNQEQDYVFISYSSKDWKRGLYDIVYDVCTKKGLRVYFDTKFDVGSDSWLTQFKENMNNKHCKAVLAFISPNYKISYATLMELMASQETSSAAKKPVLPIYIGNAEVNDYDNTGLGTQRFADSSTNDIWDRELKIFNDLFLSIVDDPENLAIQNKDYAKNVLYKKSNVNDVPYKEELTFEALSNNLKYWENKVSDPDNQEAKRQYWQSGKISPEEKKATGEMFLNKFNCAKLITMIIQILDKNNIDGVNKNITQAIYDKLNNKDDLNVGTVFDPNLIDRTGTENESGSGTKPPVSLKNQWTYHAKGVSSILEWDGTSKSCIVLKGSRAGAEAAGFVKLASAKKLKDELVKDGIIVNDEFVRDYSCNKIATMINVLNGGSVSMPDEIKKGKLRPTTDDDEAKDDVLIVDSLLPPVDQSGFEYLLWGKQNSADKLSSLMHQVFDLIAQKYPKEIDSMADNDSITAIARKKDVDEGMLPASKLNYFQAKKEHTVGDQIYYVSTRYNREQGLGQLKKMLTLCEGNADALQFTKMPKKTVHVDGNKKHGIGELIL